MKIGICKLCLEENELCNSHIIPEFAYKYVYDYSKGGRKISHYTPSISNNLIVTSEQKGYREPLLCRNCENKFSKWEKYVKECFEKGLTAFAIDNEDILFKIKIDYTKFKLFFMSILWRCGITTEEIFRIDIGQKHTENLRNLLLNENVGNHNQYQITIQQIEDIDNFSKEILHVSQLPIKVEGFTVYCYFLCGYKCCIFVGSQDHKLLDEIETFTLKEDNTIIIALENFKDNFEVQQLSKFMNKSKNKM